MDPKRTITYGPRFYTANHKRKRMCEPNNSVEAAESNFERPIDLPNSIFIEDEIDPLSAGNQDSKTRIEIKDDPETLPYDRVLEITEKSHDQLNVCSGELGLIPIDVKAEPEDVDVAEIKADPLAPGDSKNVTDFLNDGIKVEWDQNCEYSGPGQEPPISGSAVLDAHNGGGEAINEENNPDGPANMVLDPETGLFMPADDANEDIPEDNPENINVFQDADDFSSWNNLSTTGPCDSSTGQPQCPQPVAQPLTTSAEQSPVKISLDLPKTPANSSKFVSVEMLLNHNFTSRFWSEARQNDILLQPIPLCRWDHKAVYDPEQIFLMDFDFYRFPWLCESNEIERFFCWSCLLFGSSKDIWSVPSLACADHGFGEALIEHQSTLDHLNAQTLYEHKKKVVSSSIRQRNLETCQTLWRRFVQTICHERRKNCNLELQNPKFFAEVQDIANTMFHKNIPSKAVHQFSKKMSSFATHYLKMKLVDDVKNAQYVTLHLEDLSAGVEDKTWIAVIARFADQDGVIDEKVIDFVKMFPARTTRTVSVAIKWIKHIFSGFKLNDILVGFSYSASVVGPQDIPAFHELIRKMCPKVLFFHSPLDNLYISLFQAISHVATSRKYLKNVQGLCDFLSKNQSLIGSVEKSMGYFTSTPLPKMFDAHFSANLRSYYSTLLMIFERIVNLTEFPPQEEREAKSLVRFLHSPKNCMLMVLVGEMSSTLAGFAAVLGRCNLDLLMEQRTQSVKALMRLKSHGIAEMHKMTGDPTLARVVGNLIPRHSKTAKDMIDAGVAFLTHRFENMEQFLYTSSDLLKSTLKLTKFPVNSQDFIKRAGLNQNETFRLKFLVGSPHSPLFVENKNHTDLLNLLIRQKKTVEYPVLHKYLSFVHLISFAKTEQKQLLKNLSNFCRNASPDDLTHEFLNAYFWRMENDQFEKLLEDPELYLKALQVCQLKVIVENEYDVKIVE